MPRSQGYPWRLPAAVGLTKVCADCRNEKSIDDFYNRRGDQKQSYCKQCHNLRRGRWAKKNPEKNRQWNRNYEQSLSVEQRRETLLRTKYKMSLADFEVMLASQDGRCAACRTDTPGGRNGWHVDHDHGCCPGSTTCGQCVRGILCHHCNAALGLLKDSRERLEQLMQYLSKGTPGQCQPEWVK